MPLPKEVDAAFNKQYDEIHVPVFFNKLAAYGIQPGDEEEARLLLQMGADLFARHQVAQEKQAGTRKSLIKEAAQALGVVMTQFDKENGLDKQAEDRMYGEYAAQLARNPELVKAASTWLGHLAAGQAQ